MAEFIPHADRPIADARGLITPPWQRFLDAVNEALNAGVLTADEAAAGIRTIAIALGSSDGDPANIPPFHFLPPTTYVHGGEGVNVDGTLAGGGVALSTDWPPTMARISLGC